MGQQGPGIHEGAMSDQALSHSVPAATPAAAPSRYWRTEDWIAVVLGFLVITAVLLTFQWKVADLRNVVPTLRWTTDEQVALLTPNWNKALDSDRDGRRREGASQHRHAEPRPEGRARDAGPQADRDGGGQARRDRRAHAARRARRGSPQPRGGVHRQGVHARQSAEGRLPSASASSSSARSASR